MLPFQLICNCIIHEGWPASDGRRLNETDDCLRSQDLLYSFSARQSVRIYYGPSNLNDFNETVAE
jgi:hypothetical protein